MPDDRPTPSRPSENRANGQHATGSADRDDSAGRNGNRIDETARPLANLAVSYEMYILSAAYQAYRLRRGAFNLAGWMTTYLMRRKQGLPSDNAAHQAIRGAVSLAGFLIWNKVEFEQSGWMAQAHEGAYAAWSMVQRMPEVLSQADRMGQGQQDFPVDVAIRLAAKYCSLANAKTWHNIAGLFPKWLDWPDDSEVLRRARYVWRQIHGVEDFPTTIPPPKVIHNEPPPGTKTPPEIPTAGPAGDDQPATAPKSRNTNTRVREHLEKDPSVSAVAISEATGIPVQTIRNSRAWKEHRDKLAQSKSKTTDAMDRSMSLTPEMLAVRRDSRVMDPADIAAEHEEQEDSEGESIDALRGRFFDWASPSQKARFNRLPQLEQESELRAWSITGDFLPDEPPVSTPLRQRMQRQADHRPE